MFDVLYLLTQILDTRLRTILEYSIPVRRTTEAWVRAVRNNYFSELRVVGLLLDLVAIRQVHLVH